jgi:hypothetical protein
LKGVAKRELDGHTEVRYRGPEYELMTSLEGDTEVRWCGSGDFSFLSSSAVYYFFKIFMVKLVSGMGPAAVVLVWQLTCATTQEKKSSRSNRYCVRASVSQRFERRTDFGRSWLRIPFFCCVRRF